MGNPQDLYNRVIEEVVGPRLEDQRALFAVCDAEPLPVARTDLLYIWDEYRNELLDFASLLAPLGHNPQPVSGAIIDHIRHYGYTAPQGQHVLRWPVEYAKDLSAAFSAPSEPTRKVLFCEGQRDAVQSAVRLACAGKPVAILNTGWHNWLGLPVLFSSDWAKVDWSLYGALLVAPVDTTYQMVPGLREWMLCARTEGVPVIIDESVTGFGRTGTMWGQEHAGLVADLTVLGGACGGGLPLGVVIASPDFFDSGLKETSPHAGHPWACAGGRQLFTALHPGVLAHVIESGEALAGALSTLQHQFPNRIAGHHGVGLLRGLRFVEPGRAEAFPVAARAHGLHVGPAVGQVVPLAPPLVASTHEVTRGVDLIADVLMSWEDS